MDAPGEPGPSANELLPRPQKPLSARLEAMSKLLEQLTQEVESIRNEVEISENASENWGPNESLRHDAMERRRKNYEELRERGELITAKDLAELRDVRQSTISEALKAQRIFRVRLGGRDLYPRFFAEYEAEIKDIEAICKELGPLPGAIKYGFFQQTPDIARVHDASPGIG